MFLCDNDHEEICYEGRGCPLCDANQEIEELKGELEEEENAKNN
jgi:hypothetical protein